MATWVMCRSISESGGYLYVNLDQVVRVMDTSMGAQVIYSGADDAQFFVAGTAQELFAKAGVVPSA